MCLSMFGAPFWTHFAFRNRKNEGAELDAFYSVSGSVSGPLFGRQLGRADLPNNVFTNSLGASQPPRFQPTSTQVGCRAGGSREANRIKLR